MPRKDGTRTKTEAAREFFQRGREIKLTDGRNGVFLTKVPGGQFADVLVDDLSGRKRRESFKALCECNLAEFQPEASHS